jgi:hypothetical protein
MSEYISVYRARLELHTGFGSRLNLGEMKVHIKSSDDADNIFIQNVAALSGHQCSLINHALFMQYQTRLPVEIKEQRDRNGAFSDAFEFVGGLLEACIKAPYSTLFITRLKHEDTPPETANNAA